MSKAGRKPFGYCVYDQNVIGIIRIKRRARKRTKKMMKEQEEQQETSFAQIAWELEDEGYKTHTGVKWYPQLVAKILKMPEVEKKKAKSSNRSLGSRDKMSIEQVWACRAVCPERDRIIMETLLNCGLRATELCSMQIQDVAVYSGKSEIDIRGKGGHGKVTRTVEIDPDPAARFREYLEEKRPIAGPKEAVFLNIWDRPLLYPSLLARIKSIGKKAKIPWLTTHKFRHTSAVFLYNHTLDILAVKKFLGHKSVKTTEIYADTDESKRKANAAGLFAALNEQENRKD